MQDTPCTYRISVKAIIKDAAGRVLLGRETDGAWELPGGGLEHGEAPKEALAREILEETGFTVDWISDQPIAFWSINKEVGSPTLKWFAFVAYEAKVSGEFNPSHDTNDEVEEIRYVSEKEAGSLQLHDNTKPYFVKG
jgi:8-oxo-dGTP pyrophosphatase MutT (NUDIX family)